MAKAHGRLFNIFEAIEKTFNFARKEMVDGEFIQAKSLLENALRQLEGQI